MRSRLWAKPNPNQRKAVVIGGGISGLAAAHRLWELSREKGMDLKITVLEASAKLGGLIETERRGDLLLEGGPDAFLSEKPWAQSLCERIGMGDELIPTNTVSRRSFIAVHGGLEPMPEGFYLMAPAGLKPLMECKLLSWMGKLRVACEPFIPRRIVGDESVASFIRRRLGAETLHRIAQPMVGGIYAADLEKLSIRAALPKFYQMEREHGSILNALRKGAKAGAAGAQTASGPRYSMFLTPRFGMIRLVEMLARRMLEVELKTNTPVVSIEQAGKGWNVRSRQGDSYPADLLIVALPAHPAAALLKTVSPAAAKEMEGIPYESAATVTMAFGEADLPVPFGGFGFVVPPSRASAGVIGCTFSSIKFAHRAPAGTVLLRAFVGGALSPDAAGKETAVLEAAVRAVLKDTLQIVAAPRTSVVHRYPKSMPQYEVGHLDRIARVEKEIAQLSGLALAGNWLHGVGIPHCIHQAELAAESLCGAAQSAG